MERDQFIMPGFIDCHTHASQYPNLGLGFNCTLLDWMDKYSLPVETQYYKIDYAQKVYAQVVVSTFLHMHVPIQFTPKLDECQ